MSSIHILDDDSLLNVFHLYRPTPFDEDKTNNEQTFGGEWICERWWYKLVHVCQRWRFLIFGSASHLNICLLCTYRTPVADMLTHFPHLPLVIDHYKEPANYNDETGILIALVQQPYRVRRIRLGVHVSDVQRLIAAIDYEFPMLEYLCITPSTKWDKLWTLPITFRAPRLRYLMLADFTLPIRSPLLTTEAGLVALTLESFEPSADFSPNRLLERLSLMHHLQSFAIHFSVPVPGSGVSGQPLITIHVTLPNLRSFAFQGESDYLEALLPHTTTPLLEKLYICLTDRRTLSVPHLLQFIIITENFTGWLSSAVLRFNIWDASVELYPDAKSRMYSLCLCIQDPYLNQQVAFTAHVLDVLRPVLSEAVHLTLEYPDPSTAIELALWHNQPPNRADWRKALAAFGKVRTLSIHNGLIGEVSRSLLLDDWESPKKLLPELDEVECYGSGNPSDAFAPFIDARKNAGRPVTLIRFEHFSIQKYGMKVIRPTVPAPFRHYLAV